jgi:outer membrane protein assembly factor BamB
LALLGLTLYGTAGDSDNPAQGSLFSIPTAGGPISTLYPAAPVSRVFNLAIGSGDISYFGAETSSTKELMSLSLSTAGSTPAKAGGVGTLRGAPVVAKNDRLYTLNTQGRVTAWTASTLAPLWNVDLPTAPGTASPTLDCRRDAAGQAVTGPGTLYIPAATRLYAFIVDSPGLDPNAPWPKFQHDARNTGNPATPITPCP